MTRYSITLDLTKYTTQLSVPCKNTDVGREIAITLHQNGVPYTLTADNFAVFVAKNSAGADIVNDCVVDLVNNCVVYKITPQTIANGGNIPCEIQLFGFDREQIGSPTFNILVRKSILEETDIESSDEYGTLNAIINDIRRSLEAGEFDGKSAYQYAVEYGYEGSEEEFGFILADLKTYKEYTDQHLFDHDEAIAELQGANEQLYMIADEVLSKADNHEKRITNLEKGLPDDRFETDDTVAYVKHIPTNACPYAAVEKVGGMTKKSDNLIPFPYYYPSIGSNPSEVQGVTITCNEDGTITVNGTSVYSTAFNWQLGGHMSLTPGKYFLSGCPSGGHTSTYKLFANVTRANGSSAYPNDFGAGTSFDLYEGDTVMILISIGAGATLNNVVFKPMLNKGDSAVPYERYHEGVRSAKVTAIESAGANKAFIPDAEASGSQSYSYYEVGNIEVPSGTYTLSADYVHTGTQKGMLSVREYDGSETLCQNAIISPGTSGKVQATFTVPFGMKGFRLYIYSNVSGTAATTSLKASNFMLASGEVALPYYPHRSPYTYDIPTEVQELDGYGEGAGTASNGIVWENGEVWYEKKVHTIDLGALNWEVQSTNRFVAYLPTDKIAKPTGSYKIAANAVCSKYDNLPQDTLYANKVGIAIQATAGTTVYVYDTTYSDATTFKSAMNGVSLCYEMQTPETTDISDLITADNLIEVEGGGTLTFVNEYGAAVPSTILYQVKGE